MKSETEPMPDAVGAQDLIRYPQAAEMLGVPVGTVYAWVHHRRIPHVRLGPRLVRFSRAALRYWLDRHAVQTVPSRREREAVK